MKVATKAPKTTKAIKEIKAIIEAEGGLDITCKITGGSHYLFSFKNADGLESRLITANSPGDHRNSKNLRAEVRRMLRGRPA